MAARTGVMVATCAVLEVNSDRKAVSVTTAASIRKGGSRPSSRVEWPINSETPLASTAEARLSPPPKRISTPQGKLAAVCQSIARLPLRSAGSMKSATAASTATPLSVRPLSGCIPAKEISRSRPPKTHSMAVQAKTARVTFSPRESGPSFWYSSASILRPPGISSSGAGKITRVMSHHAIGKKMIVKGSPIISHFTKVTSCW